MIVKSAIKISVKVIVLTFLLLVCFILASILSGLASPPTTGTSSSTNASSTLLNLLLVSFLETIVLTYIILRSNWTGWKLVGAVFLAFYGLMTVVLHLESIIFLPRHLPPGMISKIFLMGAIEAGLFSPLAILILGKMRPKPFPPVLEKWREMSPGEWGWKSAMIVVSYVILYFVFGYFIAWKNPAVHTYYGGVDPGNFFAHLTRILARTPWIFPFQALRALLWMGFALPVIRMLRGQSWEVGLALALLFAVWSSQLLIPNPYMPREVARVHLVETAVSNFIFGWLVGWLLSRHHSSVRDLFTWKPERMPAETA